MTIYTIKACEDLMNRYLELGGEITMIEEGCLGLGVVVCSAVGKKYAVIKEVFLNEWSSGHVIRLYKKLPKKYEQI